LRLVWASTTPVPPSYHSRNDSDVVRLCGKPETSRENPDLFLTLPPQVAINAAASNLLQSDCCRDVVFGADLYARVVERCGRDEDTAGKAERAPGPAETDAIGYPATSDCAYLQDDGVHFSELGRRFTGLLVSAAIAPRL
jgi:hypothetical protein